MHVVGKWWELSAWIDVENGGIFHIGGLFGGTEKPHKGSPPANTLPAANGSIPSLAPNTENPESQDSGFFYACDLVDDVTQSSLVLTTPVEDQVASGAAAHIRSVMLRLAITRRHHGVLAGR